MSLGKEHHPKKSLTLQTTLNLKPQEKSSENFIWTRIVTARSNPTLSDWSKLIRNSQSCRLLRTECCRGNYEVHMDLIEQVCGHRDALRLTYPWQHLRWLGSGKRKLVVHSSSIILHCRSQLARGSYPTGRVADVMRLRSYGDCSEARKIERIICRRHGGKERWRAESIEWRVEGFPRPSAVRGFRAETERRVDWSKRHRFTATIVAGGAGRQSEAGRCRSEEKLVWVPWKDRGASN